MAPPHAREHGLEECHEGLVRLSRGRGFERHLVPELRKHIVAVDIATPATFARYSGSPTGSNYDMSPYPSNFGARRLKMRTPIAGLYLPKFSHGILSAMHGGLQAVDMILEGAVMGGCVRLDLERAVRLRERNRRSREAAGPI